MERICPFRLVVFATLLATISLIHTADARGLRTQSNRGRGGGSPTSFDTDSELLQALEFLEQYERARNREDTQEEVMPAAYGGFGNTPQDTSHYPFNYLNDIDAQLPMQDFDESPNRPLKWEDEEIAEEDLYPPSPEDLEVSPGDWRNEVNYAETLLDSYRTLENQKQHELFENILGDVMAEKILQEDEEENIAELLKEQDDEEEELEDLAALFDTDSEDSSSSALADVFYPEDMASSVYSAASESESYSQEAFEDSADVSEVSEAADAANDSFYLGADELEALEEAERILKGDFQEGSEESESPDGSDITSYQEAEEEVLEDTESAVEEEKEAILRDAIYRIVEDTLRKNLESSSKYEEDEFSESGTFMQSSVADEGSSVDLFEPSETKEEENEDELLDGIVAQIHNEVDKLSEKIMRQIEDGKGQEYSDISTSEESADEGAESSSEDMFLNAQNSESSSIFNNAIGDVMMDGNSLDISAIQEGEESSMVSEEEMTNEELINAIKDIVPAAQTKVCPVLEYLVDDCSVVDGLRGLGSGGYKQAFSRPCNRHQLCYTCSASYGVPTRLCDEIYKAELLTLCNGDAACKQRAKYFWLAALNDRTPLDHSSALCNDRCVLDYLLSD